MRHLSVRKIKVTEKNNKRLAYNVNANKEDLSLQEKKIWCLNSELSKLQSKQLDTYEE